MEGRYPNRIHKYIVKYVEIDNAEKEKWRAFEIEPGYFFFNGHIYFLPSGWLLSKERVRPLELLVRIRNNIVYKNKQPLARQQGAVIQKWFEDPDQLHVRDRTYDKVRRAFVSNRELLLTVMWHAHHLGFER